MRQTTPSILNLLPPEKEEKKSISSEDLQKGAFNSALFDDLFSEIVRESVSDEIDPVKEQLIVKIGEVLKKVEIIVEDTVTKMRGELTSLTEEHTAASREEFIKVRAEAQQSVRDFQTKAQKMIDQFIEDSKKTISNIKAPAGPRGADGADGHTPTHEEIVSVIREAMSEMPSPETADSIAAKINSKEEIIEMSSIKGLKKWLTSTAQNLASRSRGGGGGGGMGNVQHETFPISAGTTSVTTNFRIAGNGNAIFKAAYQGMETDKGVHFTVASNQRTINFDSGVSAQFENNTTFSITYVRT